MLNRTILIGRLTKGPELRYTPAGVAVCTFTLAVDRPKRQGQQQSEADFLPIVVWRQAAEASANYLRKGRLTAIEGRIQTRNYENNEGRRVYVTEIHADNVRFLERGEGNQNTERQHPDHKPQNDPFPDDGKPIDISDDDLPF